MPPLTTSGVLRPEICMHWPLARMAFDLIAHKEHEHDAQEYDLPLVR